MISREKYVRICESFGLKMQGNSAWKIGLVPDNYHFKETSEGTEVCRYLVDGLKDSPRRYIGVWPCRIEDGKLISKSGTADGIYSEKEFLAYLEEQSKVFAQAIKEKRFDKIREL